MTSKFKVGDKVQVLNAYGISIHTNLKNGDEGTVFEIVNGCVGFITDAHNSKICVLPSELDCIEKISKNQRITVLEETVALQEVKIVDLRNDYRYEVEQQQKEINELKLIIEKIRKPSTVVEEALTAATSSVEDIIEFEGAQYKKVDREAREGDVVIVKKSDSNNFAYIESAYIETQKPYLVLPGVIITDEDSSGYKGTFNVYAPEYGRTPETVDVYELIVEDISPAEKSPNEKRAEMIEKAKMFIEKSKNSNGYYSVYDNNDGISFPKIPFRCKVEFIVNEEKRTVIALMRGFQSNRVLAKGIAKCMPGDVFNKYIGMAIALGRALNLDVSEFEQAVQPTEFAVGQTVEVFDTLNERIHVKGELLGVESQGVLNFSKEAYLKYFDYAYERTTLAQSYKATIINDTNAIYGGGE